MKTQTKHSLMLMLCAFIWGTAFVAQSAGSGMGAYSFLAQNGSTGRGAPVKRVPEGRTCAVTVFSPMDRQLSISAATPARKASSEGSPSAHSR